LTLHVKRRGPIRTTDVSDGEQRGCALARRVRRF
jgi:hypothetical protein